MVLWCSDVKLVNNSVPTFLIVRLIVTLCGSTVDLLWVLYPDSTGPITFPGPKPQSSGPKLQDSK